MEKSLQSEAIGSSLVPQQGKSGLFWGVGSRQDEKAQKRRLFGCRVLATQGCQNWKSWITRIQAADGLRQSRHFPALRARQANRPGRQAFRPDFAVQLAVVASRNLRVDIKTLQGIYSPLTTTNPCCSKNNIARLKQADLSSKDAWEVL